MTEVTTKKARVSSRKRKKETWTAILLVVDRSGSMREILGDAQGGIDAFLEEQAKAPGLALLWLADFDTEFRWVHEGVPVSPAPAYKLQPRGWTALLNAVGTGCTTLEEKIDAMPDGTRPDKVVAVIVTDGHENRSSMAPPPQKRWSRDEVKEKLTHLQQVHGWQVVYLGADVASFDEARNLGVRMDTISNYDPSNIRAAFGVTTQNLADFRAGRTANMAYSVEQRGLLSDTPVLPDPDNT